MRKIIDRAPDAPKDGMTVPCDFPQMLDGTFREQEGWAPPPPKRISERLTHETLTELRARFGPNWGLKLTHEEKRSRRAWRSPTDDELRARYRRQPEAAE